MALTHATSGEIVSLGPLTEAIDGFSSHALVKSSDFEAIRLFLAAGNVFKDHKVDGSITLQCLEGAIDFRFDGETCAMGPGDWLYLDGGVIHSLSAREDSSLLLTIMLHNGPAPQRS